MFVRFNAALVVALLAGHAQAAMPAETIEPWSAMTAAKFKMLPDTAQIRLGNRVVSKAEILAMFSTARAAPAKPNPAPAIDLPGLRAAANQSRLAALSSQNGRLLSGHQQASASARQSGMGSAPAPSGPSISGVEGVAQNEAYVWVKGSGFGNAPGTVYLKGNFPGGQVQLVTDMGWSPTSVVGKVVLPNGGAPEQSNARIVVVTKDGKSSNEFTGVHFVPEMDVAVFDWTAGQVSCSQAGWSNTCEVYSGGTTFTHLAFPDGSTVSGQDVYSVNLKNGWTLKYPLTNSCGGYYAHNTYSLVANGPNAFAMKWTINTNKVDVVTADILQEYAVRNYTCSNAVTGPKGMPWH